MAQVDIAAETLKVGNALTSVRIDNMILNLAKGIAWGQYDLDKVGVQITKMMGVPGTVSIGGEQLSMLEAGFIPSFYHFVDTIIELKMEVKIREEQSTSMAYMASTKRKSEVTTSGEVGYKASAGVAAGPFTASAELSAKAGWKTKNTAAYSTSVDAKHSQSFNQDLSASSLMRTKLVPVPPPEVLVERIKILLENLRKESEDEDDAQVLFTIDVTEGIINSLDTGPTIPDAVKTAFAGAEPSINLPDNAEAAPLTPDSNRWTIAGTGASYYLEKDDEEIKVYQGSQENKKSLDDILMGKIEERLMERLEEEES